MAKKTRKLRDSMGTVEVPADALYQAQTQRALDNFRLSQLRLPASQVAALARIKRACALANFDLGLLDEDRCRAIVAAADEIVAGDHADQFGIDVFQTGSGTSSNMNVNEVIATLASSDGLGLHPNDHVNMGQSSNDVFPSSIHVAASLEFHRALLPNLRRLEQQLDAAADRHADIVKTGRTHLMDAMPIRLAQEISAWTSQIRNDRYRLQASLTRLQQLAIGGTAVGTGVNTPADFGERVCAQLEADTGVAFRPMENRFEGLATQNTSLEASGQLRVLAASYTKICNDLRWMNSGPLSGLGEIRLEALQPGSSIMPGKVNPVLPEAILMVAAQIGGNDATIAIAAASGNFQLNVMLPVIAYNLLQSIEIAGTAAAALTEVVDGFSVDREALTDGLARNPVLVTALNPLIGYERAAEIAKTAFAENRPILDVALEMTDIDAEELASLLDPARLTGA